MDSPRSVLNYLSCEESESMLISVPEERGQGASSPIKKAIELPSDLIVYETSKDKMFLGLWLLKVTKLA